MSQATLSTRSEDGHPHLFLAGEIDMSNADQLGDEINAAIGNQVTRVVVDLTEVTYIDSAGVRILVMLASRLEQMRVELRLVVPSGTLARRVIEVTGLGVFATDSS